MKSAILIGATGLVGGHILEQLLESTFYTKVDVFTRRSLNIKSDKLEEHLIDFDNIDQWKELITGDDLFSAMGTTIKKAGSQEAQYLIDYTYPYQVASWAKKNGVKNYALISSAGADSKSKVFYSRMKGELDRDVTELGFKKRVIVKPSIIEGIRTESRLSETIGLKAMHALKFIPGLSKYQPAPADLIASCMIKALNDGSIAGNVEFEWNEVLDYAKG
jgi:uncharacterized protein YbjT (DUF2867 family)